MDKQELAKLAARLLNLANTWHTIDEVSTSERNEFHAIIASIPDIIIEDTCFWNNGTISAKDLLSRRGK